MGASHLDPEKKHISRFVDFLLGYGVKASVAAFKEENT